MKAAVLLYGLLFGDPAADLSAPSWADRERAVDDLAALWPLSRPAIVRARASADPEVRALADRADRLGARLRFGHRGPLARRLCAAGPDAFARAAWLVRTQSDLVPWRVVEYALADPTNRRLLALWLVTAPFEDSQGLPWVPQRVHEKYGPDRELARALCDVTNEWWAPPGERVWLACDPIVNSESAPKWLGGLDNVRFWARGLPEQALLPGRAAADAARVRWRERKDPRAVVTDPPSVVGR